jgi:formate hydrogenlyase subunit 4
MENITIFFKVIITLFLPPLFVGIINKVKALFGGREGQSVFQLYYDLFKLFNKGIVYSKTTTLIFYYAPIIIFSLIFFSNLVMPCCGFSGILSFNGDFIFIIYILGLIRFFIILSAMDCGSSFEGMGASREAWFSVFGELAFFLSLIVLSSITKENSLYSIFSKLKLSLWTTNSAVLALVVISMFFVLLVEASRVPFDDPNTHLELTMIHEVMILDNSGVDFAFMVYASSLKMWFFASFISNILLPSGELGFSYGFGLYLFSMFLIATIIGIIESTMARIRLLKVPQLLLGSFLIALVAFVFQVFKG